MVPLQIDSCPDLTNSPHGLYNIWNAASVILGFQLAAFTWRMSRERDMERADKPTWFPIPRWCETGGRR
jgi:hypothetical protein